MNTQFWSGCLTDGVLYLKHEKELFARKQPIFKILASKGTQKNEIPDGTCPNESLACGKWSHLRLLGLPPILLWWTCTWWQLLYGSIEIIPTLGSDFCQTIYFYFWCLWNCVWKKSLWTALGSGQNEVDSTNLDSGQVEGGCRRALNTLPHSWSPSCRGPYPVQRSTFSTFSQRLFGICGNKYYSPSSSEGQGPIRQGCQSFSSENLFSSSRLFVLFSSSFSPSHSLSQPQLLAELPAGYWFSNRPPNHNQQWFEVK